MAAKKKQPKYPCGICGKKSPADKMIYSRHTGQRYCGAGIACGPVSKRRQKQVKDSFPSLRSRGQDLLDHYAEAA